MRQELLYNNLMETVEIIKNDLSQPFIVLDYVGTNLVKVVNPDGEIEDIKKNMFPSGEKAFTIETQEAEDYDISYSQMIAAQDYIDDEKLRLEKASLIHKQKKCKQPSDTNLGEYFERQVASCLIDMGCSVTDIEPTKEVRQDIKKALSQIINKKYAFRKLKDIENMDSLSSDFYNPDLSISCKRNNKVVKHPKLGRVFSMILGEDICSLLNMRGFSAKFLKKKLTIEEFCETEGSMSDVAKRISKKMKKLLPSEVSKPKQVKEIYQFLMGKDTPVIITEKNNVITLTDTRKIKMPKKINITYSKKGKIVLEFDNGVCLEHRIKWGINGETRTVWTTAYKEEWKRVNKK